LIMLARARQRREFAMHGIFRFRFWRRIRGVERQRRWPGERGAHQCARPKHIGPHQRAPGSDRTAEIMSDHGIDMTIAERRHQAERVAHKIKQPERIQVAIVIRIPAGGAPIAALVRCDHMVAGLRQRRHYLAPAESKFREAVQQQEAGPAARLEAGFEHMYPQAVDVLDVARADSWGQGNIGKGIRCVHGRSPSPLLVLTRLLYANRYLCCVKLVPQSDRWPWLEPSLPRGPQTQSGIYPL